MPISEKKMQIVMNNYFNSECNINTSIREAFEKGFRIGVQKGYETAKPAEITLESEIDYLQDHDRILTESAEPDNQVHLCDFCKYSYPECPAEMSDVIFGNGIGHDNVCACSKYIPFKSKYKSKVIVHDASITTDYGETFHREEYLCDNCKRKILSGDNFCSHCGVKLDWDALVYYKQ